MIKVKYLILGSFLVFVLNFLTLLNLNFTRNQGLQSLGIIIALACVLLFLLGYLLAIQGILKRKYKVKVQNTKATENLSKHQLKTPIKKWVAIFIFLWIFVIYPAIMMSQMSLLQKIIQEFPGMGGNIGALGGVAIFIPLVMISTIYPGLYLNPLIVFFLILLFLSFYFFFSSNWHKIADVILLSIVLACLVAQLVLPSLIGMR